MGRAGFDARPRDDGMRRFRNDPRKGGADGFGWNHFPRFGWEWLSLSLKIPSAYWSAEAAKTVAVMGLATELNGFSRGAAPDSSGSCRTEAAALRVGHSSC
jgi:hypothetical protein